MKLPVLKRLRSLKQELLCSGYLYMAGTSFSHLIDSDVPGFSFIFLLFLLAVGCYYYVKLYQNVHILPFCLIIDFQIFVYLKL